MAATVSDLPFDAASWLISGAFVVSVTVAVALARSARLEARAAYLACVWGSAGALLGGRLWAAMLSPGSADLTLLSILEGPKGAIGAALGGGIACAGYLLATRRSVPRYADAMLPAAFAGYVVARLGCLLEGCCFGTVSNVLWAVHYPAGSAAYIHQLAAGWIAPDAPQSLAVHPIGGYHMAAGSVLAFATWRVRMWPGWPLACALIGYGALRVVLGTWRGGDAAWALGLAADQWAGMGLLVAGLVVASSVHVKTNVV